MNEPFDREKREEKI